MTRAERIAARFAELAADMGKITPLRRALLTQFIEIEEDREVDAVRRGQVLIALARELGLRREVLDDDVVVIPRRRVEGAMDRFCKALKQFTERRERDFKQSGVCPECKRPVEPEPVGPRLLPHLPKEDEPAPEPPPPRPEPRRPTLRQRMRWPYGPQEDE